MTPTRDHMDPTARVAYTWSPSRVSRARPSPVGVATPEPDLRALGLGLGGTGARDAHIACRRRLYIVYSKLARREEECLSK